jgi:hypothetical protein
VALQRPSVQTYLAQRATEFLSKQLNTRVEIEKVKIVFFNSAELKNFYLEDLNKDTAIYAKNLEIKFGIFELLNKRVDVKSILLQDSKIHLHRDSTGKVMNLAELFKGFASAPKDTTVNPSKGFNWNIHLEQLGLKQIDFRYLDEKSHLDLRVAVPDCNIAMDKVDLKNKIFTINSANISNADVSITLLKRTLEQDSDTSGDVQFMPKGMKIAFTSLNLKDSRFRMNDLNVDTIRAKGMDFKHLDVQGINLVAKNGTVTSDTILTRIDDLMAADRSGFTLKHLSTNAQVTTNDITLSSLDIETPTSRVRDFLSFRYSHFRDFKDFLNAVRINASFGNTKFSLKDLGYFITILSKVEHNTFTVNGVIDGRINNLKGKNLDIRTSSGSIFKGNFYARGLPKLYETSLNLKVDKLSTNVFDLKKIYPELKLPENLSSLGQITYSGTIDGFVTDMVTNGKLTTSIGYATSDLNFKYDKKNNKASYSGKLALNEFDIGKFLRDSVNFGKVSINTQIIGKGITAESLDATLNGNVSSIVLRNHDYRDITIEGVVLKKSFSGLLQIRDPSLDMDFKGSVNLTNEVPSFNFNSVIRKAELQKLNLVKEKINLSGKLNADFSGGKIDEIIGQVTLDNVKVTRDTFTAELKHTTLNINQLEGDNKDFKLVSDFANIEFKGQFTLKQLPEAVKNFVNLTFFKIEPDSITAPQNFSASIQIDDPKEFTHIIHPKLHVFRNANVSGSFSSNDNSTKLTASFPEVVFDQYKIKDIAISNKSLDGDFSLNASAKKIFNADSLMIDTLQLNVSTIDKDFRLDFSIGDKNRTTYANTTAFITPLKGKAVVKFLPSEFKLGQNIWSFAKDNRIEVSGKKIVSQGLIFKTTDQRLFIDAYLKNDTSTSVKLTLDNTSITDFTGIFTTKIKDIKGFVNGKLTIEDVFYKPRVFADFVADEVTLGNELVGDINIESRLDDANKRINILASVKSIRNDIDAKGYVSIDPLKPGIKIDIDAKQLGLNFLNYKFFDRYVKRVSGNASAKLLVSGTPKNPLLTGSLNLNKATVTVSFLNTEYHLKNQTAILDEHGFYIPGLTGYDIKENSFLGSGRINHESFRNFEFDLLVTTENAQFLNTTAKEMPGFNGVAYGKGRITFKGPVNMLNINARATTGAGTHCYLPIRPSYETGSYTFYKFVNPKADTTVVKRREIIKPSGVNFQLDLDATPDAIMDIILDPTAGDILSASGNGSLQIQIARSGNITMLGDYEIVNGSYLFTLQNIINKRFDISKGSRIKFGGDIYKAALDVDAVYEVRTSTYDLIQDLLIGNTSSATTSTGESQLVSAAKQRIPTKLLLKLGGILEKPIVSFDIKVNDPDPVVKTYVDQRLNILRSNETEMNNQVFGLLVMNRFLPPSTSATNALTNTTYLTGTAANTVSEFLSSQLSNYLSNLLDFANVKNLNIDIGYRQYDQLNNNGSSEQASSNTRRELQLALTQSLLNNRLTLNAGGNLDFGNSASVGSTSSNSRAVIPTGDFQIEYALTKDGVWRAKAFNRTNYDYYNSRNSNKTGIGLSYRQEFDKPSELFKKKKPKKKTPPKSNTEATPVKED